MGEPAIGEIIRGPNGESLGVYAGSGTVIQDTGSKSKLFDLPMGVKAAEKTQADLWAPKGSGWEWVDLVIDYIPDVTTARNNQGMMVSQYIEQALKIRPPGAFPLIVRPPRCARCQSPVRSIRLKCHPTYATAEMNCHGYSSYRDFKSYELPDRGNGGAIYDLLLQNFDDYGATKAPKSLLDSSDWKIKKDKWKKVSFRSEDIPEKYKFDQGLAVKSYDAMMKKLGDKMDSLAMAGLATSSIPYTPDCCLCKKPVRVTTRDVYERDGYEVMFECHGRREVLFVSRRDLAYSGRELGGFVATASPFLSDFKKLEGAEEAPKQKPKPRTGLTITIGQERVINLE